MTEPKITGAQSCGCKLTNYPDGTSKLSYCDLHAAAPQMYEALKAAQIRFSVINQKKNIDVEGAIDEALQKVEGKDGH